MYDDGRIFLVAGYWAKLKKAFASSSVYVIADTATIATSLAKRCMPQFQPAGVVSLSEIKRYVAYMERIVAGEEICLAQEGIQRSLHGKLARDQVFVVVGFSKSHSPDRDPIVNFVAANGEAEAATLQQGALPGLTVSGVSSLPKLLDLQRRMERVAIGELPALKEQGVIR
ncbi:hypothetical protein [Chromobacterium phragmitis]|uniref:Uncharacterized protein n=1 Tax=Chromobacterium phragmitis TaxID=2202141 RepID=A0ABV0IPA5_9NEIS